MNNASRLEAVTVYAKGAVCERVADLAAGTGPKVTITGLPLSLRASSLRARTRGPEGSPTVREVRPGFEVTLGAPVDVSAEQKALDAAEVELARLQVAVARVQKEIEDLSALAPAYRPTRKGEPPREAPVEATLQLAAFVAESLPPLQAQKRTLDDQHRDASNEAQLRRRRLAEASNAQSNAPIQIQRTAEVLLSGPAAGPLALVIEYLVPGARWLPTYELQLGKALTGGVLRMRAAVAQCTGEDWAGVRLALSTADLDRRIEKPELRSIRIGRTQPAPPRSGWRDAPPGLDALFADFDALGSRPGPVAPAGAVSKGESRKKKSPARQAPQQFPEEAPMTPPRPQEMMELSRSSMVVGSAAAAPMPPPPPAPKSARSIALPSMARAGGPPPGAAPSRSRAPRDMDEEASLEMSYDEDVLGADAEGSGAFGGGGAMAPPPEPELTVDSAMLDYDLMRMAGPGEGQRGRLKPASMIEVQAAALSVRVDILIAVIQMSDQQASAVDRLTLPQHARFPREVAGSFDYRYLCETPADVPSVAAWKVLPVATADVAIGAEYQCVPSVEPKVYRTVNLKNRSVHAVLAGPVDVFVGGGFLLTAPLPTLAPGGEGQTLGLGVEEAIKVARNTSFRETTGGLLGGSTVLPHEISIDLDNRTAAAATIEVRERVPVSTDDEVKIEELKVEPPWKKDEAPRDGQVTRGARSWKVTLAAGEKKSLVAEFSVKIPSSRMLHGGNRRV